MASTTSNDSSSFKMILGSSSPARSGILSDMGYQFTAMVEYSPFIKIPQSADIDEKAIRRETPDELVKALAEAKAEAIRLKLHDGNARDTRDHHPTLLITCDQVMVCQGIIRERPRSTEEAREFIKGYSGGRAFAVNYVLVTNLSTGARRGGWDVPEVVLVFADELAMPPYFPDTLNLQRLTLNFYLPICFHRIPDEFIDEVAKKGEMTCVAGGLKLTHPSVLPFIRELVGTADSVRGLPRELTEKLIRESLQGN